MNANQIVNMILRQIVRRLVNGGINAGMSAVSKRNTQQDRQRDAGQERHPDHAETRRQGGNQPVGKGQGKQVKQAMRNFRRINRF